MTHPLAHTRAVYDSTTGQFLPVASVEFESGCVDFSGSGAPTDAVAGTGYGTAAQNALYVKTGGGLALYKQTSADSTLPTWSAVAAQPALNGVPAPTDGVTDGATNDYYWASGASKLYRCTDGAANTWVEVASTNGAGAPTSGVRGTGYAEGAGKGSTYRDATNGNIYRGTGTALLPTWSGAIT